MVLLWCPAGVAKTFERNKKDFANGNTERGVEAFMPTAARNMYRSIFRYSREGALTRRGDSCVYRLEYW